MRRLLATGLLLVSQLVLAAGDVHEYQLDNGLKLIVKEDHRAPVVVSQVWYKVGRQLRARRHHRCFARAGAHDVQGHKGPPRG